MTLTQLSRIAVGYYHTLLSLFGWWGELYKIGDLDLIIKVIDNLTNGRHTLDLMMQ